MGMGCVRLAHSSISYTPFTWWVLNKSIDNKHLSNPYYTPGIVSPTCFIAVTFYFGTIGNWDCIILCWGRAVLCFVGNIAASLTSPQLDASRPPRPHVMKIENVSRHCQCLSVGDPTPHSLSRTADMHILTHLVSTIIPWTRHDYFPLLELRNLRPRVVK